MGRKIVFFILCIGFLPMAFSQIKWSLEDKEIFNQYVQNIRLQKPDDHLLYTIRYFLNVPYGFHTLEIEGNEQLVVNLHELDCMTYVENVLALIQAVKEFDTISAFEKNLRLLRYRNGTIAGYLSRLHYFSDWIQDNEHKGMVRNVTCKIGGIPYSMNVSFMSSNENSILVKKYPQYIDSMKILEHTLNQQSYCYFPKKEIKNYLYQIKTGDILAITTDLKGLDIAHLGFAYWKKDTLCIIHASSSQKKVVENIFLNYFLSIKHFTGIVVVRTTNR